MRGPDSEETQPLSSDHDLDVNEEGRLLPRERNEEGLMPEVGADRKLPASIWWIYFVLGAAILLPWNAIITAMPYFMSRLAGSAVESAFSSYLSTSFTVVNFFALAHATANTKNSNSARTTRITLVAITALTLLLTLSTFAVFPAMFFFFFVIFNGMFQAVAGSHLQSAVVAVASLFGPAAMQSMMAGQGAIGVMVSLIQVLSAIAGVKRGEFRIQMVEEDDSPVRAAFLFFGISTLFMVFAIMMHAWLVRIPAYKAIVLPYEVSKGLTGSRQLSGALKEKGRILEIAKLNKEYNFAVAYVFIVTLAVFPAITSSIRSVHVPPTSLFTRPLIFTAIHFLVYNVGDFAGRYLPILPRFQIWSSRSLLYMSVARTLFIPAFLACNVNPSADSSATPVVINSDLMFFLILLVFGMTNGYIGSLVMMAAPSPQHNARLKHRTEDVDIAATVAQFCLIGGLAIGSFMSFGVRSLICGCNPFVQ